MRIVIIAPLAVALVSSGPLAAASRRGSTTDTYTVTYHPDRDAYCVRIFDAPPADPRPNPSRGVCQSQAAWAQEGIQISDPLRDGPSSAALRPERRLAHPGVASAAAIAR